MKTSAFAILLALTTTTAASAQSGDLILLDVQPLSTITQPTGPQRPAAGFACPNEFTCDGVEHFFRRIEGDCVTDPEQGIFCTGPDGPEVPHPG